MLSIVDIKRELGKNIYIYPLIPAAIKSNSVDLHASHFAWSVTTKKSLVSNGETITIPPHDTALVYSMEAIYVSNKIGGIYSSKVRLVSNGIGAVSGSLDAQYVGLSIISLHNVSDEPKEITVGSEFVTVTFFYLHSDDYADTISHNNPPGHVSLVSGYEDFQAYQKWEEDNRWCRTPSLLRTQMIHSNEYEACKKQFEQDEVLYNRKFWKKKSVKYGCLVGAWLLLNLALSLPAYSLTLGNFSALAKAMIENFSVPLLMCVIIPNIILDYRDK